MQLILEGEGEVGSHPNLIAEVLAQGYLKYYFMVIGILFGATNVLCLPYLKLSDYGERQNLVLFTVNSFIFK